MPLDATEQEGGCCKAADTGVKVLLINGSPNDDGCTYTALREIERVLEEEAIETEWHWIGRKPVAGCIACGRCKETGQCIFDDDVNRLLDESESIDGMILGSPVYYAGPTGQLCSFLDRLFFASNGRWNGKLGASVISCRRGGATAAFDRLNKYFTICSMPVVSSQYWNQVHGMTPADVRKDEEGLQTMRTLGRNFAYLLKAQKAAAEQGIEPPEQEAPMRTNFIR